MSEQVPNNGRSPDREAQHDDQTPALEQPNPKKGGKGGRQRPAKAPSGDPPSHSQDPVDTNPTPHEVNEPIVQPENGPSSDLSKGPVEAVSAAYPPHDALAGFPQGAKATALKEQMARLDIATSVDKMLRDEFALAAAVPDVLDGPGRYSVPETSAAAFMIGSAVPGLEVAVPPSATLIPRVADPAAEAAVALQMRGEPVFADAVDAMAVKIQLTSTK